MSVFNLTLSDEDQDGVPCPDCVPLTIGKITECIISNLKVQCSKILSGSWSDINNFCVELSKSCGLSNYLYIGYLNDDIIPLDNEPRKVLIRVYGEVLRSCTDSIISDSVNFALLSEKRIGPKLHGVFPGGRIEEYIESRPLTTQELPLVIDVAARHMASFHKLCMPFPKTPSFIIKMFDRYLSQLTSAPEHLHRPSPNFSSATLSKLTSEGFSFANDGHVLTEPSYEETRSVVYELSLIEEYKWIKEIFEVRYTDVFPIVFCHNDFQENNLLLLNDPKVENVYRILPIDFEYSGYNYRAFDIGNHFNEWCYDYTNPDPPYFFHNIENYPDRSKQRRFWDAYLTETNSSTEDDIYNKRNGNFNEVNVCNNYHQDVNQPGDHIHEDKYDESLWIETIYGSLLSHLFWSAWSLVQSQLSSIQFDFIDYAKVRMKHYHHIKSWLPPKYL
ncbi:Choline/ethanolamine kinase isoform 2 [Schistosoma japonicum]|uniref:Choline/ethanolamine kinase isoform 2 n=2 Tax=Schistosoma japonicum TaxID=6182 RepID=A0A4Z2D496_SCHJA|nr:Choline/ethanolamine kinase [Schistosoma japonicum]KAH8878296.1 Choline/ethanolamine kinase [Schistosoma japonicum]KAH8878298.1 Choline/ethanolamine kinase [Schistosoma japonicum]TNN11307.1 Choline/ethanolamine kinase isoform 2 [Schistosoma japonicum]TNN11308.1 Choline/ethanolamine kinase isoform 2 [Schistosoma japonicum]